MVLAILVRFNSFFICFPLLCFAFLVLQKIRAWFKTLILIVGPWTRRRRILPHRRDRPILPRRRIGHRRRVESLRSAGSPVRPAVDSGPRVACFAFQRTNLRRIGCSCFRRNGYSYPRWIDYSCSPLKNAPGNFGLTIVADNFRLQSFADYFLPPASSAAAYLLSSNFRCRTSANRYRCFCKHCHHVRRTCCHLQFCLLRCSPRRC